MDMTTLNITLIITFQLLQACKHKAEPKLLNILLYYMYYVPVTQTIIDKPVLLEHYYIREIQLHNTIVPGRVKAVYHDISTLEKTIYQCGIGNFRWVAKSQRQFTTQVYQLKKKIKKATLHEK